MSDLDALKRELVDRLELSRKNSSGAEGSKEQANREIDRLHKELNYLRANNELLNEHNRQLENQVLAAMRDAEHSKRELARSTPVLDSGENERLLLELQFRKDENVLLAQALIDSENEISRLVRELTTLFVRYQK